MGVNVVMTDTDCVAGWQRKQCVARTPTFTPLNINCPGVPLLMQDFLVAFNSAWWVLNLQTQAAAGARQQ